MQIKRELMQTDPCGAVCVRLAAAAAVVGVGGDGWGRGSGSNSSLSAHYIIIDVSGLGPLHLFLSGM